MADGVGNVARPAGPEQSRVVPGVGAGTAGGGFSVEEEDVRSMLGLFAQLGKSRKDSEHRMGRADVPITLERHAGCVRSTPCKQALAGLAAQAPDAKPDKPMLLKTGGTRGDPLSRWTATKKVSCASTPLKTTARPHEYGKLKRFARSFPPQEEMMAQAGLSVQSYYGVAGPRNSGSRYRKRTRKRVLDFGRSVGCVAAPQTCAPFPGKTCLRRGELKTVNEILMKYASLRRAGSARSTANPRRSDLSDFGGIVRQRRRQRF